MWRRLVSEVADRDPVLRDVVDTHGIPVWWSRRPGFPSLVLLILEQQVSLASAAITYDRLAAAIGEVTPRNVLTASGDSLRAAGVSRQKDRYLRALADAVDRGLLDLEALSVRDDDEVRRLLTALPGIGSWTADSYLLACLERPDVWPVGDRALQVAVGEVLGRSTAIPAAQLVALGDRWRPHRSTAARLLWHSYLSRRGRA